MPVMWMLPLSKDPAAPQEAQNPSPEDLSEESSSPPSRPSAFSAALMRLVKCQVRPEKYANSCTCVLFTVLPVLMFATILVLKLRGNYVQELSHLQSSWSGLGVQLNTCVADRNNTLRKLHVLEKYEGKCRATLASASATLAALNTAFRIQWERSDEAVDAMNRTRVQFEELKTVLDAKDNLTATLLEQNAALKKQVAEMSQQLHNLTSTKINLEGQLGKVKIDLDGLKMNTTRLEGEKEGLKKVLTVKSKIDDEDEEEDDEKSSEKRGKRVKKYESAGKKDKNDDEEEEEEPGKREKDSIEQIVKEHIQKLGLANGTSKEAPNPAALAGATAVAPAAHPLQVAPGAVAPVGATSVPGAPLFGVPLPPPPPQQPLQPVIAASASPPSLIMHTLSAATAPPPLLTVPALSTAPTPVPTLTAAPTASPLGPQSSQVAVADAQPRQLNASVVGK